MRVSTKCFNHPRVVRLSDRLWLRWWQLFDLLADVFQNVLAFLTTVVRFTSQGREGCDSELESLE